MKTYRSTFALIGLFFAGLLGLWWLESSGVLTEAQRRERMDHILPDLLDTPEAAITRLEISSGGQTLAFERRGKDRWQMTEPVDAAADPTNLETLVRNLKGLRRSPDTGTIFGPAESYGLAPPAAVVRLWESQSLRDREDAWSPGRPRDRQDRPATSVTLAPRAPRESRSSSKKLLGFRRPPRDRMA